MRKSRESRVESLEPEAAAAYNSFWLSTLNSPLLTLPMHTIRLRGPWQLEPVFRYVLRTDGGFERSEESLPAATKQQMPGDWSAALGGDFLGRVRYVRPFNAPPGLMPDERVWLVVEPQRSQARVMMSEETLGDVSADGPPQTVRHHAPAAAPQSAGDLRRPPACDRGELGRGRRRVAAAGRAGGRSATGN